MVILRTCSYQLIFVPASVLWSGTPVLTWPKHRHKMCSRVAASVVHATGFGGEMVVSNIQEYEERAVFLAQSSYPETVTGENDQNVLINLRRNLYLNRDQMPLFDTRRWVRNLETGYSAAWGRWVDGSESDNNRSGCIYVHDDDPIMVRFYEDREFK